MAEEWLPARLIPTSGIRGAAEQESRATSALLSVLGAVQEFGRTVLRGRFGAPAGPIEAYIEVPLELPGGEVVRPDGLIRVRRGSRTWTALFEVKTGRNELDRAQVENYLDAARQHNFDAVVTISNQIVPATGDHPVDVDRRKLRRVALHHISWVALLTEAVLVKDHRGVEDPDHAWILGQLIAYLEHPQSGAMEFADMGSHWTSVRDSARAGTLTANSDGVDDVVDRWDEFSRYLCLHLGRELGADVEQVLPRRDRRDTAGRKARLIRELADEGNSPVHSTSAIRGGRHRHRRRSHHPNGVRISLRECPGGGAAPNENQLARAAASLGGIRQRANRHLLRVPLSNVVRSAGSACRQSRQRAVGGSPRDAQGVPRHAHTTDGDAAKRRRTVVRWFRHGASGGVLRIGGTGAQGVDAPRTETS